LKIRRGKWFIPGLLCRSGNPQYRHNGIEFRLGGIARAHKIDYNDD
jgi:hypothetical protein